MTRMGDHSRSAAAGRIPRRAMFSVWSVFLSMAGTTMTFQVYHSIHYGRMPWELAVLYGVVPLAISIGVLDFVAEWEDAPVWASPSAYLITAGSMFLSAAATGSVVLHAAPAHLSGVFGLLLDGAALLAIRFILTAPRKARERAAEAERRRAEAERAEAGEIAVLRRQAAQRDADVRALGTELNAERITREAAQRQLGEALRRIEALTQEAASRSAPRPQRSAPVARAKTAPRSAPGGDGDVTAELRALMELQANPELCKPRKSPELAELLGISKSYARKLHGRLTREGAVNPEVAKAILDGAE